MSTFVAHAVAAFAISRAAPQRLGRRRTVVWAAMMCACAPDLDVVAFAFGFPYGHALGHRGFSHSLLFAILLAAVAAFWLARRERLGRGLGFGLLLLLFVATASHGLIDAMTNGGLGVGFYIPFDNARYFLPWRPLVVPPLGVAPMFSAWGFAVVQTELLYIGLPSLVVSFAAWSLQRNRQSTVSKPSNWGGPR